MRRYLFATAAITGAAIMVVEILGARMLSPYVGTSHFVWTAQIAVTLVALACGYYAGGRLADSRGDLSLLYLGILGAAGYLLGTVEFCQAVANHCLDLNLAAGSLLAAAALFFVPLALLAMTGPFLVKVITSSVADVGSNVGRLTAIGTVGSFLGTVTVGYVMLPLLALSQSMHLTALTLALVAGGYFLRSPRKSAGPLLLALVCVTATTWLLFREPPPAYTKSVEVFSSGSHFGEMQVVDSQDGSARFYLNDGLIQNAYDPVRKQGRAVFTYMLTGLGLAYTPKVDDVLCVGLGVGLVPMDFVRLGARVDVVEINPDIIPVAARYFGLEAHRMGISIDDGRHFLNRCSKQYDLVVLDAFLGDSSPSHLMSLEAFREMRRVLRPDGTLVVNAFGWLDVGKDFMASSLYVTLREVFPGVRIHSDRGQLYFVATGRPEPEFLSAPDLRQVHPAVAEAVASSYTSRVVPLAGHGMVLTDDRNPTEFYDAANREALRRALVHWGERL